MQTHDNRNARSIKCMPLITGIKMGSEAALLRSRVTRHAGTVVHQHRRLLRVRGRQPAPPSCQQRRRNRDGGHRADGPVVP